MCDAFALLFRRLRRLSAFVCAAQHETRGKHTRDQSHNKEDHVRIAGAQGRQRTTRAKTRDTPADPKDAGTTQQFGVKLSILRDIEPRFKNGTLAAQNNPVSDKGNDQRAAHHKSKAWVPAASNIKEIDDLGRVGHAGQGNARTKNHAGQKCKQMAHAQNPITCLTR